MPAYSVRTLPGRKSRGFSMLAVHSAEPMTVGDLLVRLVRNGDLPSPGCDEGDLAAHFVVLINGRSAHSMEGADTLLMDGDTISILSPVAGG